MNFSITINGEGNELSSALKAIKAAVADQEITGGGVSVNVSPVQSAPAAADPQPVQAPPVQQNVPTSAPPAQQQAPTQQQSVPTSDTSYTMEQLGVAAGPLVDAGKGPELTQWLQQKGAQALTHLDKSFYGEFATYLRSLGAKI